MVDTTKVLEGIMAINKPMGISSAQTLNNLQRHFNASALFAPWLATEQEKRALESRRQQRRSSAKRRVQVKIGHGGTLDPLATGVLIVGIGRGTKSLQNFLGCTKSYETVVLFGAATDTYDTEGAVVRKAPHRHITETSVRNALIRFRGKIMQRPPIYSALRIDGKRLYEYAREGKELPREIEKRPVEVEMLEMVDWMAGGRHTYRWPEKEAEPEKKLIAAALLSNPPERGINEFEGPSPSLKRKRADEGVTNGETQESVSGKRRASSGEPFMSGALQPDQEANAEHAEEENGGDQADKVRESRRGLAPLENKSKEGDLESSREDEHGPAAARLRMTVTSGFYVRSLCHDLGEALGSLGIMSELVRTRQGNFELGKNVLDYEDLAKGEEVWGPKVQEMLENWETNQQMTDGSALENAALSGCADV